jgi:hypothetical protein
MPSLRTEITEIVTGLATLPFDSAIQAFEARPPAAVNVGPSHWERLVEATNDPQFALDFVSSWNNGKAFLEAADGLRGRSPLAVEWKGPHQQPGPDFLPADLRIDHVYLVSCKYLSKILANPSPAHLFQRTLAGRGARSETDWFLLVAPSAYRHFYHHVRAALEGSIPLPVDPVDLTAVDRGRIKQACARNWPVDLQAAYEEFSAEVSRCSAAEWNANATSLAQRELLLWRILRFNPAPYFILGSSGLSHVRLRVATPWDWRQRFRLIDFSISAEVASQPRVGWSATVKDRESGDRTVVAGHVEIRWSHGRFCGFPEAKLYLDTPLSKVPGYFPLQ